MTDEISKDVDLLDKVLLRFGIADDSQLEKQLDGLLVPVLAKLNSTHEAVRKKVLEVLAHVNKRVKPVQTIKLPIQQLMTLYNDPTSSNFLLNFAIIYLDMGWSRAPIEDRKVLFPGLLSGISKRPAAHQDVLLHMAMNVCDCIQCVMMQILDKVPVPRPDEKGLYSFSQNPADVAVFLNFVQDILLLYFVSIEQTVPAGMSKKGYARMTAKIQSKEALLSLKTTIIDWLWKSGLFAENDIGPLLIIASCDTYHNVVQKAEDALKRIKLNYEDATFVDKLYKIYQGTANPKSTEPADEQIQPASVTLKTKLLNFMSRSIAAANVFPGSIQVIFDAVYGQGMLGGLGTENLETNTRLKTASMIYVQWVFRFASNERLHQMGPIILSGLLKLIAELKKSEETQDSVQLKNYSYSAVGLLAKRVPSIFRKDLTLLTQMFASLREPSEDKVKTTIFEALQMMCPAFHDLEDDVGSMVQQFLLETVTKDDPLSRLAALYFANRIFPFRNVPSRIMCLLSLDDIKMEVKEEAQKGLKPYKYKDNEIILDPTEPYPEFSEVIQYVYRLATATYSTTTSTADTDDAEKQQETKTERAKVAPSRFKPNVYEKILGFARTCLEVSSTKAEASQQTYLENMLNDATNREVVSEYLELIDAGLGPTGNRSYLHHATLTILLEFLSFIPDFVSSYYAKKAESFRQFLFQGSYDSRELAARIFGLFSSKLEAPYLTIVLKEAIQFSDQDTVGFDKQLGSVLVTGFVLSRLIQHRVPLATEFSKTAVEKLFNVVNHFQNPLMGSSAITAIGWIGRYSPLPVADGEATSNSQTSTCTKLGIIEKFGKLVNSQEGKVIERAAQAISNLCLGQLDGPFTEAACKGLFEAGITHSNNLEVHFTVGEALSCLAAGWSSKAAKDTFTDSIVVDFDKIQNLLPPTETTKQILDQILSKYLIVDRSRSAACLWLLSLVKHAGHHSYIKTQLPTIQMYFTFLLSDSNEVTQECASKGLVFVYEQGDEQLKKQLVRDLTETLSGGKKSGFKLSEETKLVPEGLLKNPEGEGYSTYKELCSLATEMGQPELVYKFINLTAHSQLWSSRKGAAFAVSGILSQAADELNPMLPSLIPKLYRYSFDPNPKISASMKSILNSIMEPKKVLTDFFKPIMRELLESLNNNLWRVREGACFAMSDALQGRNFDDISEILEECWFRVMRVIDDIKESVRLAAKVAFKSLSTLTSRLCDPQYTNPAQAAKAIDIALPFLLQKGLINESDEVKGLSLDQILKITKVAGKLLGPHIPLVVGVLLEGLSSLEPSVFSYLSFHTEKMNISQEQLDESRMLLAKMSPMNDTLEHCVKYVDESNLSSLVSKLVETINTGVGLPTRAGVAKFISSILLQKADELKPHASKLMLALLSSQTNVKDKSVVLRKANANAIAGLAKLVPPATLKKLIDKLIELAKDTENTESRISSAVTFLELLKRSPEELKPHLDNIVPVIFLSRHDPVEEVAKIYKDAWEEFGLGNSGIRSSLDSVVNVIIESLGSSSWSHKKQAALALKDIGESSSLCSYMKPYLERILATLSEGLGGRLWQGKETLIQALSSLSTGCKNEIWELSDKSSAVSPLSIVQIILKECKRNDKEYKRHAMTALAATIQAFNSEANHVDIFGVIKEILIPIAVGEGQTNNDNLKDEDPKTKPLMLLIRASAFKSLGEAFPHKSDLQKQYITEIFGVLLKNLPNNVWNIRVEVLSALRVVLQRLSVAELSDNLMKDILSVLLYDSALNDVKYAVIRNSAVDILSDIIQKVDGTELLIPHLQDIQQQIQRCGTIDMNSQVAAEKLRSQITDHLTKKKKT